jgi:pimeloyl-ACP methyl ester carboxylesterase
MPLLSATLAEKATARAQANQIEVGDTVTRYWFYPANRSAAKSIVFVHGYRGNHRGLEAIAGALEEFNIYIPDLPGFGESTPFASEHSLANYSSWLSAFIKKLNLAKPIVLGHSFGTIVCAKFAAGKPEIEKLILVNPVSAPALEGPKAALTKIAMGFFWLSGKLPLRAGEFILKSWPMVRGMSIVMTKTRKTKLRKWVHAQHDANFNDFASRRVAIEGYRTSVSNNVSDFASQILVHTLLIIGAKDDITSPNQQRAMAAKMSAPVEVLEHRGVGHLTHYEIPDLVAADVRRFIGDADV